MSSLFDAASVATWCRRLQQDRMPPAPAGPPALDRPPLHVVYGGAHRFTPDVSAKLGRLALASLDAYAGDAATFAAVVSIDPGLADEVHRRVRAKLQTQPVDDFRIDFEDGYGPRADAEEDAHARAAGEAVAEGQARGSLPPAIGLRVKALDPATAERSLRTLGIVLDAIGERPPPSPFLVTLPKATSLEPIRVLADALTTAERARGWPEGGLQIELMLEDPRLWFDADGRFVLRRAREAAGGRLAAAHLGPYDYTATIGVAGADQQLFHPALDVARHLMQVGLSGSGVRLGDGPTMLMPIPPHRPPAGGHLSEELAAENRRVVHQAWRHHAAAVEASMRRGFDLGWDLHPAQIPARLGAVYAAYRAQLPAVAARLRNFVEAAGQATRVGAVFDDAATGQGLVNFCLRAIGTGAMSEDEIVAATGLGRALLSTRSFAAIVAGATD